MTIYIILYFLLVISIFFEIFLKNNKKITKLIFIIDIILITIIQCIRSYDVGTDLPSYFKFIDKTRSLGFYYLNNHRFEYAFKIFSYIFVRYFSNKTIFLSIISIFSNVSLGYLLYKKSKNPFLSLLLYLIFNFYAFTFSGLRQTIAFSFIYISYFYLRDRKLLHFILFVVIAGLFHKSAYFFFPAYYLYNIKLNRKNLTLFALFSIVTFIFRKFIYTFSTKYFYDNFEMLETGAYRWALFCLLIVLFCLLFYKKTIKNDYENNGLYILSLFGALLMTFTSIGTNVLRVANYYFIFIIILIPNVLHSLNERNLKFIIYIFIILFGLIVYIFLLRVNVYSLVPYNSILGG